ITRNRSSATSDRTQLRKRVKRDEPNFSKMDSREPQQSEEQILLRACAPCARRRSDAGGGTLSRAADPLGGGVRRRRSDGYSGALHRREARRGARPARDRRKQARCGGGGRHARTAAPPAPPP